MLFHVPEGASGTFARSVDTGVAVDVAVGAAVAVDVAVGAAVAVADADAGGADADADAGGADADAVSVGLAVGQADGESLAVAPTQPAATSAMIATTALHLGHLRSLTNRDCTACPPEDHSCGNASVTPS
jgi:hypothetical protein